MCEKSYICNPATYNCEHGKYLASIIDDSVIMCDENIDTTETVLTTTLPSKSTSTYFYSLLVIILIAITLLIAVSTNCCLIKYWEKQKHLLQH